MKQNLSVHLQPFPNLDFLQDQQQLIDQFDTIRQICSSALSLREQHNLRVRLPLLDLEIIGTETSWLANFCDLIADEINIKKVKLSNNIDEVADLLLQINFKQIGATYGEKVKDIIAASKNKQWQQHDQNIAIAGVVLQPNEFSLKLTAKPYNQKQYAIIALPSNDYLLKLNIELNPQLIDEGISRDIIRSIQQSRKEANLQITDMINLKIASNSTKILQVVQDFSAQICSQVLAHKIDLSDKANEKSFLHQLEEGDLHISFEM